MPDTTPATTTVAPSSGNYVGFWRRFAAAFIDSIVINIISFGASSLIHIASPSGTTNITVNISSAGIGIIYFIYFWSQQNGQTLGAKVLKFRVVREDNKHLDIKTAVIRYIGYILSIIPICLGLLWVVWDKKKQGWHDKMAGTVVVRV